MADTDNRPPRSTYLLTKINSEMLMKDIPMYCE